MKEFLIFDMDDTLIHTTPVWRCAEERFLLRRGFELTPERIAQYHGKSVKDIVSDFCAETGEEFNDSVVEELRCFLLEEFGDNPRPTPGADNFLRSAFGKYPMVVASGSPRVVIEEVLNRLGWTSLFNRVVSSEEVSRGKPSPDVFEEALALLKAPAAKSLIFEDSLPGIAAAKAAGVLCCAINPTNDKKIKEAADHSVRSFGEITPDKAVRLE